MSYEKLNPVYIEAKNGEDTFLYDIRNISFEREVIVLINSTPQGMYQLVIDQYIPDNSSCN
jgi:hypothetical protein